MLYSLVHSAFAPILRSYSARQAATGEQGGKQGLPTVSKKFSELEYALQACLQSMEIPEVSLQIDPLIAKAAIKAAASKRRSLSLEDMPAEAASDSNYLNSLQSGVNKWVREIQKVTRLQHDAGSGPVSQEIKFWHAMERALAKIKEQVEGSGVSLTLSLLKQSGRALATIVFDSDTSGLKATTKRVNHTMLLMRDFPIDALLSATDIRQITEALVRVFTHLKKIKAADEYL